MMERIDEEKRWAKLVQIGIDRTVKGPRIYLSMHYSDADDDATLNAHFTAAQAEEFIAQLRSQVDKLPHVVAETGES